MRLRLFLLIACLILAGCTEDPAPDTTDGDAADGGQGDAGDGGASGDGSGDTEGGSDVDGGNATENRPPTASMTINVTGEGPRFSVVFEINGTDPDGDTLSWTLDADSDGLIEGEGTGLPKTFDTEVDAGMHNATLFVTDGTDNITVVLAYEASAAGPARDPFSQGGVAQLPCPQCSNAGANTGAGYRAGESGVDSVFFEIPAAYIGGTFTATASAGNVDMVFRDGCSGGAAVGDAYTNAGDETGTVPEGAACILMWSPGTQDVTLTLTIV